MAVESLYAHLESDDFQPLTDEPCAAAPQTGVHLYHFSQSLCSQKVRQVLDEKGVRWEGHVILLPAYEQYEPDYVRINPRCVVPTLVRDGKVTTDSENILRYVERTFTDGPSLVPEDADEADLMKRFVSEADALFVEALTYGDTEGQQKSRLLRRLTKGVHEHKVELLSELARQHAHDPTLKAAYEQKLALVRTTLGAMRSPQDMAEILARTEQSMDRLEEQLKAGPFSDGGWLCSRIFSLADIEWGVVLLRMKFVGLGERLFGSRPQLASYAGRLVERPAFKSAVLDWSHPFRQVLVPTQISLLKKKLGLRRIPRAT